MAPDVSVIIPTRGRPRKVANCVRALARQTLDADRYEVLVGLDGPCPESEHAVRQAWSGADPHALTVVTCPTSHGPNPVRNRLMREVRGNTVVALNDDIVADPNLLAVHHAEQRRAADAGRPALIVGRCPWFAPSPADDRLFDRLIRETSMVFFYNRMNDTDPDRNWGYRHAWSLNLSLPTAAVNAVGGWAEVEHEYGHDDLELAWRLGRRDGMPVRYRPSAIAAHDHRITPREYLHREFRLGRSAWHYARQNAAFAFELFGRDITSPAEIAYARSYVARERGAAARLLTSVERLADLPSSAVAEPHATALVNLVYEHHLPLKRWMWRGGLLAAASGRPIAEVTWP